VPELPDLAVYVENLTARLKGKAVQSVGYHRDARLNTSHEEPRNSLCHTSIASVERSGKEIAFFFSNKTTLVVHLMLSGSFVITLDPDSVRFRVLTIGFEDSLSLVVSDPKGLMTVKVNPIPSGIPDALEVDETYLRRKIAERPRMRVKAFLMDQAIIRGIGNAYADEILWQARISPASAVGKIPDHLMDDFLASLRSVLTEAIEEIRRQSPEIISGEIRNFLRVHNSKRSESPTGHRIMKEKKGSQVTYFTQEQVLYV
jgi:formamidopyrimidine-DNA glycosylase